MPALEDSIRAVLLDAADRGQPDMTPREAEALAVQLARKLRPQLLGEPAVAGRPGGSRSKAEEPTRRHVEALEMLADGGDVYAIAAAFGIGRSTVYHHLRALAKRWGLPVDVCVLVNAGFERGWLALPRELPELTLDARGLTALGLIAAGRGLEIGDVLGLSSVRVGSLRKRLMAELGAASDAGLVAAGWRAGLLPVAPRPEVTGASTL